MVDVSVLVPNERQSSLLFRSVLIRVLSSAFCRSTSAKKREGDLAAALSRASTLETQLNKSEAVLTTAQSQNASLNSELMDVKSQLAKVGTAALPLVHHKFGLLSYVDLLTHPWDKIDPSPIISGLLDAMLSGCSSTPMQPQ